MLVQIRTELSEPFCTTEVDSAGPFHYKVGKRNIQKAYALSKVIGNSTLSVQELGDVLLSTELLINNRPLTYIEKI